MANAQGRFAFEGEWFDQSASLVRKYHLLFYTEDNAVELVDLKSRRTFLKRTRMDSIQLDDLFIGASVNIYSRQIKIVGYADNFTEKELGSRRSQAFLALSGQAVQNVGEVLDTALQCGYVVAHARMVSVSPQNSSEISGGACPTGTVIALELFGGSGDVIGDVVAPVEQRLGAGCIFTPIDASAAAGMISYFFGERSPLRSCSSFQDTTLCIIKPHAVAAKLSGRILEMVSAQGFRIEALQTFTLNNKNAEEFLEVYKGVVPEYPQMLTELTSGTMYAVEVSANDDAHGSFREFAGPADPEIARKLRPRTLRAHFGVNKVKNAVHCTDLAEDAPLEVEYFFKIMQ